jgi:hypothetical protein
VSVIVLDPSGAVVPDAQLRLQDIATNDVRTAATSGSGTYTFVNLSIGTYKLTVSKSGFETQVFASVVVQTARTTDIEVTFKVGAATVTVEVVEPAAPLVETTATAIGTTIDLKRIENLPLQGRNLYALARLSAGYTGTWNGLPTPAQGNNFDGVISSPTRAKYQGVTPSPEARIESVEEMSVQTDQMDMNQGFGQTTMQVNFVTRRGTNEFHGRVFEDFRNDVLNANSWGNNARGLPRNRIIRNEFGGAVGGPILRDRLFFFVNFSMSKQPGTVTASNQLFTTGAQAGNFTYTGTDGLTRTLNVLTIAQTYNPALPGTVNSAIASLLSKVNTAATAGAISATSDPNLNTISWLTPNPSTVYYPTFRVDYNLSSKLRMNLAFNMTRSETPANYMPTFPGSSFSNQQSGILSLNHTAGYGLDWTISPALINQFRFGFLYFATHFGFNAQPLYATSPTLWWDYPGNANNNMSGSVFTLPVTRYYPLFSASDTVTWQRGAHRFVFGFSFYREQDHYWNPPAGFPNIDFGLAGGDPAVNAFTNTGASPTLPFADDDALGRAQQLYAILTGRISWVQGEYKYDSKTGQYARTIGAYNLNELSKAFGLFGSDSYRIRPNLTINYGLRWDFTGDNYDMTMGYHSAYPDSIYGPSGVNNLFNPGSLLGNLNPKLIQHNHVYEPWNVSPQPALGIAWSPNFESGILGKLIGKDATVFRGGFALRYFTEPYQYYWNVASNYGSFFYQRFVLQPNTTGQVGTFMPGSLALGQTLPAFSYSPAAYQKEAYESDDTFINAIGVNGMNPKIRQPYTESWNVGIQRKLGASRAIEIRYSGNRTIHQWIAINPNEVNVFENGFLAEFQHAQSNLTINGNSFANLNPAGGTVAVPIFTAAFTGSTTGSQTDPNFRYSTFLNYLRRGQVGTFANTLAGVAGAAPFFCNLVGPAFTPCVTNAGYTGTGAGYPINFFQANPYAAGSGTGYMTDAGYSNYHALQVEFRQQPWHGMQFNANYTWGRNLGVATPDDWMGAFTAFTLRDLRRSYGPTRFDIQHVFRFYGTFDLPFGRGRKFLNQGGVVDQVVGGWSVGTILSRQTGFPFRLTGGYMTFNDYGDGGINLTGVTPKQLQDAVDVHYISGRTFVLLLDPKYLRTATGGASSTYFAPNTTPGTFGSVIYLHGPKGFYQDISVSKNFRITERIRFKFQTEFLNAWNHPVWANSASNQFTGSVQSSGFGTNSSVSAPRNIEFRANIEF